MFDCIIREQEQVLKDALKDADRGIRRGTVNMEYLKNVVVSGNGLGSCW